MKLLLELKADCCCNNLYTTDEVTIIISDKYPQYRFGDIVSTYRNPQNNNN